MLVFLSSTSDPFSSAKFSPKTRYAPVLVLFGYGLAMSPPPAPGYDASGYAPPLRRPIGVAILAILTIVVGVLIFIAGLLLLVASSLLLGFGMPFSFGLAGGFVGGIVVLVGLLWIGAGFGLWHLRGWAWWLAVIVMLLSILSNLATPALAILPVLILVYLVLVRHHFR